MDANTLLSSHKDNADISFIMLLNSPEDFEGGGTYFNVLNETLFLNQGKYLSRPILIAVSTLSQFSHF